MGLRDASQSNQIASRGRGIANDAPGLPQAGKDQFLEKASRASRLNLGEVATRTTNRQNVMTSDQVRLSLQPGYVHRIGVIANMHNVLRARVPPQEPGKEQEFVGITDPFS